jgi:biopolymer transport protein TolR
MQIGSHKVAAVINVTPMIDVLLVLLIVFMLLPTHSRGLESEAPQPAPDNPTALPNPQHVVVRVQKDGYLEVNSQPVVLAELEARLRSLFAVRPEGVLFVDGAGELDYADVATVIDIARGAGVERVGLLTARLR